MEEHLKEFWRRLQTGVEVAVYGPTPDHLLGVREGFLRYFHEGLERRISVVVVAQELPEERTGLPLTDEQMVGVARARTLELEKRLGDQYHFYVASEGGLETIEVEGSNRFFIRNWTVVRGPMGEAWGSSGAIQLPEWLVAPEGPPAGPIIPGTRRRGGILSSLTIGLENRRRAVALSTLHALSTLFYGVLQSRL